MFSKIKELILLNLIFPIADRVMGTSAIYWYNQINKMNKWSKDEIECWQNKQLQLFILHAYNHTRYYKRVFDASGIKPEQIRCKDDLKLLPVINKEVINKYYEEFIPDNLSHFKYRKSKTGGTTGNPMHYLCDENTWGYVTAAKIYSWKKAGYHYGDNFVALGSSSLFPFGKKSPVHIIYNKLRSGYPLNGVNLNDKICAEYVEVIKHKRIRYLYGYAASIYLFSKYVSDNKIDLSQIKYVFTTSEMLTSEYRKLIEDTYNCKVMDCYGARDAGITAYEIFPSKYHVGYNVIAETIDDFEKNTGSLITTNLINYAFPMIRYQFGDEVELLDNEATYNGQVILKVFGRTSDVLRLENGHNLTATGFSMLMKVFDVVAFEVNKIDRLTVELKILPVSEKYNAEQEEKIIATVKKYIGDDCVLKIEYVNEFEPLKNGKRRYFMS